MPKDRRCWRGGNCVCVCVSIGLPAFVIFSPPGNFQLLYPGNQRLNSKLQLLTSIQIIITNFKKKPSGCGPAVSKKSCSCALIHKGEHNSSILGSAFWVLLGWLNPVEFPLGVLLWEKQSPAHNLNWCSSWCNHSSSSTLLRNSSNHSCGNEWHLDETKADVSRKKPGSWEPRGDLPW